MFPKEHLAFHEIRERLDNEVAGSQEQAEQMSYFTLAMQDPKPLRSCCKTLSEVS